MLEKLCVAAPKTKDFTTSAWNPNPIQQLILLLYRIDVGPYGFPHGVMGTEYFAKCSGTTRLF